MTMTIDRPQTRIDVSAFAPHPPLFHHEPQKIAQDTYLVRHLHGEGESPLLVYMNSLVILGQQPAIVDTGLVNNREQWLADVFSLVEPKDVRWVFVSHDDHDHTGNLAEVLALCPNATLVTNWFQIERLAGDLAVPPTRMRWVDDGGSIDAGDRVFAAVRPPVFDSPTTRGLYDSRTGVYWASDCFATAVAGPVDDVSALHPEEWRQNVHLFSMAVSPWIELTDAVKFNRTVKRVADLNPTTLVSAHTPPVFGSYVGSAIDMMYDLPYQPQAQLPGQAELDAIIAEITGQGR